MVNPRTVPAENAADFCKKNSVDWRIFLYQIDCLMSLKCYRMKLNFLHFKKIWGKNLVKAVIFLAH